MNQITLNPTAIARALGAIAFLLVLASVAGQLSAHLTGHDYVFGLVPLFNIDGERNFPTGFSTLLLLLAAALLAVIMVLERGRGRGGSGYWAVLSAGFLFMAADEAWSFHEKLIRPVRSLLGDQDLGMLYHAWVVPGMALVAVLGLVFLRFWLRLPAKTRFAFLFAAVLYLGGAIGVELVGGRYSETLEAHDLTYAMIVTLEESLEMAGVIVFIHALLGYIALGYHEVRFRLDGVRETNPGRLGAVGGAAVARAPVQLRTATGAEGRTGA